MASSRLFSLSLHLSSPPNPESFELTRFINNTLEDNIYQSVCMPITNAKWADRWKRMCLDSSNGVEEAGYRGSISLIDDETDPTVKLGDHSATDRNKSTESHRIAEMWRAGISGRFKKDEVNLTKIGAEFFLLLSLCILMSVLVG